MKRKSVFGAISTLVLSLALMLSLAVTASAASITIDGNGQAGMGGEARFTAYQIFKGSLGSTTADKNALVGITWGSGVDSGKLVTALKGSNLPVTVGGGSSTFGAKFTAAWDAWKKDHESSVGETELVAQFLAQHLTDREYADDFARIVAGCTDGSGTASKVTSDGTGWVIGSLEDGYYLVKDTYTTSAGSGTKPDGAVSSYILQVSGSARVAIKSSIPTVEKKAEGLDGHLTEIGKDVNFTLTGTVAQNIGEYEKYYYKFTDTLSAGLSCDTPLSDANIDVKIDGKLLTRGTDYTAELEGGDEGKHILTVEFTDLKESAQKAGVDLKSNTEIVVTYKAKLNNSAVIGQKGNPNDVTLTYSNDPYSGGTGESVTDEVKTYTLGLDIVKQDDEKKLLKDVKFKLKNGADMYAKMNTQTAEDGKVTYTIVSWGEEAEGTELVTNEKGIFSIHGFAVGKYTIVETQAPDGYEKMKDIVFNITGEIDGTGELIKAELVRDEENLKRQDVSLGGSMLDGGAKLTLTNYKSPILPNTGGIGAKIVYVVSGLAVLIGVCVVLVALRKRKGE